MIRSTRTGRYIKQPKKTSLKDIVFSAVLVTALTVMTGYAVGHSVPDAFASTESDFHSPLPVNHVAPSITVSPSPALPSPTVTPVREMQEPELSGVVRIEAVSIEDVKSYIATKDWPVEEALAIAKCESGFYEKAHGDRNLDPSSYGVFQIRSFAGRPPVEDLMNYQKNIDWAYGMYVVQGWEPWTCKKVL